jgi:hypothetical protein
MKLFHICTKKDFEKDGEKKTKWYRIGILKEADSGRKYMKLFHQPDVEFFVFEREENNQVVTEVAA